MCWKLLARIRNKTMNMAATVERLPHQQSLWRAEACHACCVCLACMLCCVLCAVRAGVLCVPSLKVIVQMYSLSPPLALRVTMLDPDDTEALELSPHPSVPPTAIVPASLVSITTFGVGSAVGVTTAVCSVGAGFFSMDADVASNCRACGLGRSPTRLNRARSAGTIRMFG